jgi:hypothetical protein
MPPQTVHAPRLPRLGRVAALAVAITATAGVATIVTAGGESAPQVRTIAESSQSAANRSSDIEANKAASMRALGRHMMAQGQRSPARVDAAAHAATVRAIGAALAK